MGIFYGDKIYGVRWARLNTDIDSYEASKFELKFQLLTKTHMDLIKNAFQQVQENDNNQYYFQRTMTTTHEWCSEVIFYVWVKCTKEDVERVIQENV